MVDKITNEEYNYVEVNETNGIKIESGEFKDVIVVINSANIQEDGEDAVLQFDYTVIYDAEKTKEELQSEVFKNTVGNILINILENSVEQSSIQENDVEFEQIDFEESEF